MTTKNFFQQITQTVSFKLGVIAFLALILLIPAQMIRSLVKERQMRRDEVVQELTRKLGKKQTITGPVLSVPYRTYQSDGDGERKAIWHHMHFLPQKLEGTTIGVGQRPFHHPGPRHVFFPQNRLGKKPD